MYGHVEALRLNGLQFSVDNAIKNFMLRHDLNEGEDFSMEAARRAYFQMNKDYINSKKTENGDT